MARKPQRFAINASAYAFRGSQCVFFSVMLFDSIHRSTTVAVSPEPSHVMQDCALRESLERVVALSKTWSEDKSLPAPFRHMSEHVLHLACDAKRHRELSAPSIKTVRLRFCSLCHRIVTVPEHCDNSSLPDCPILKEIELASMDGTPRFLCGDASPPP